VVKTNRYWLITMVFILMMLSGCARTVTPLFPLGKTIIFDVNFKEDIDGSANRYYVILRSSSSAQIPFTPIKFIEPDDIPDQPEVNYADFYGTWNYYFVLEGNTVYLASGPFSTTEAVTKETIAIWNGSEPRNIRISYDIERLFPSPTPTALYFDFVTVGISDKIVKDNLSPVTGNVSTQNINTTYAGTFVTGSDEATPGIPGALDISGWSVSVQ